MRMEWGAEDNGRSVSQSLQEDIEGEKGKERGT